MNREEGNPSEYLSEEARRLKNEGNKLMISEKFEEAIELYTIAIDLDPYDPVCYCKRAAALSKLNEHRLALEDCKRAISCDPNYSQAYAQMGLTFGYLNDHSNSRACYLKALELDPNNERHRKGLTRAEDKVAEQSQQQFGRNPFDMSSLFANPALMNMASQMMTDPNMQNIMGGLMSGAMGGNQNPAQPPGMAGMGGVGGPPGMAGMSGMGGFPDMAGMGGPPGGGIEALLQAGQQFVAQMQATNPDLVEQLRTSMTRQNEPQNSRNPENRRMKEDG